jgi:hypothetical protein
MTDMGGEPKATHSKLYVNVMELIVAEEVDRQLASMPERVSKYIKRTEVETFALNRLPALYASSEKGLHHQYERALHEHHPKVVSAVRQAFAAVQVDPIRLSKPLHLSGEEEAVLQALRDLLNSPELTWESALAEIQRLQQRRRKQAMPIPPALPQNPAATSPPHASTPNPHDEEHTTAWRPGTYGSRISWQPRRNHTGPDSGFNDNAV